MSGYELDPGDARIESLQATCARLEQLLESLEERFTDAAPGIAGRFHELEQRAVDTDVNLVRLSNRIHELDAKLDRSIARLERMIDDVNARLDSQATAHARLIDRVDAQQITLDQLWKQLDIAHQRIGNRP